MKGRELGYAGPFIALSFIVMRQDRPFFSASHSRSIDSPGGSRPWQV